MLAKDIYQNDRPITPHCGLPILWTISFDGDGGGYFPCWVDRAAAERVAKRFSEHWPRHTYEVMAA